MVVSRFSAALVFTALVANGTAAENYVKYDAELAYAMVLASENDQVGLERHLRAHPQLAARIPGASEMLRGGVMRKRATDRNSWRGAGFRKRKPSGLIAATARYARSNGYY